MLAEFLLMVALTRPDGRPVAPPEDRPRAVTDPVVESHCATRLVAYPRAVNDLILMVDVPDQADDEPIELPADARLFVDGRPCRDTYLLVWFRQAAEPHVQLDRSTEHYGMVTAARFSDKAARPPVVPAATPVRWVPVPRSPVPCPSHLGPPGPSRGRSIGMPRPTRRGPVPEAHVPCRNVGPGCSAGEAAGRGPAASGSQPSGGLDRACPGGAAGGHGLDAVRWGQEEVRRCQG